MIDLWFASQRKCSLGMCCRMADLDGSPGERYYLRLHKLVMDVASDVLRAKVDFMCPSAKLAAELQKKHVKKTLQDKANLKREQIKLLFQTHNPDVKLFDITLLVAVLRHVCFGNQNNHPIWTETDNNKILPSMQSDLDQIVRIRNVRNTVRQQKDSCSKLKSILFCLNGFVQ